MFTHLLKLMWNKRRANGLLFLEILLAFVVLFGVFAFGIYNYEHFRSPMGYASENLLVVDTNYKPEADSLQKISFQERARRDLLTIPGIEAVSFTGFIQPFMNGNWSWGSDDNGFELHTQLFFADEQFAETMDLEFRDGRWFEESDADAALPTIVVNGIFVDRYFPDAPTMVDSVIIHGEPRKIIGVVENFKYQGDFAEPYPIMFTTQDAGLTDIFPNLVVRVAPGRIAEVEEPLYRYLSDADVTQAVSVSRAEQLRKSINRPTVIPLAILAIISGFLLINTALGLFGVLFTQVGRRRAEIGLRKALGATPGSITAQFVLEMLLITLAALALGAVFAVQVPLLDLLPLPDRLFYLAIAAAAAVILCIVVVCAFLPSRQAAGLHPALVLHEE